eukprot:TRINITY_DN63477_c0_g1_i1.p1 TRINITY_DN63477_c0_g1~~TRINITY_DN63477_c0_g1_i1.p1  ORF type:complete len:209 (-),score=32.06 TRINITY_DN63477_c0_g1_i1:81-707(-)
MPSVRYRKTLQVLAFVASVGTNSGGHPAALNDWRFVDPYLPFEESHLHPDKRFRYKNEANKTFVTMGVPLRHGIAASRVGWYRAEPSQIDYAQHSVGHYCSNNGLPFLTEGDFGPQGCFARCHEMPNCAFLTIYGNMWCQIGARCEVESAAGDPSATTYVKTSRRPDDMCSGKSSLVECLGGWVAGFGKPISLRHLLTEKEAEQRQEL